MTDSSTRPASHRGFFARALIEGAASGEAARTAHSEVGFEHLFLGVLTTGGPAARLLMDAGVGLAEARSAIDELLQEDLALLGIDAPLPAAAGESEAAAPSMLPFGPRLRELADDCPHAGGDQALLVALLDDEGGRIRRLLDRLGVDTDRIRHDLGEPIETPEDSAAPAEGDGPSDDSGQTDEGRQYATHELDVPVPAERIWDLVGDPRRRAEWDKSAVSSRLLDGGVVELTRQFDEEKVREWIAHSVPGREVTWEQEPPRSDIPPRAFRITIEPLGDHSRLHLRMSWTSALRGARGRLGNRMLRWFMRQNLRVQAHTIAQAAAS
ncbi:Clp protease N-terminal domain-containing protein [Nocardiopsis mangrovi]|uniref:Clp protease N-terminal domain-containing protein n=1 Tax=Nocardiopsis mangrovi TaxID=1179818 RepID=A0ABV9DYX0_9ACTN